LNLLLVTPYYPPHFGGLEVVAYHVASEMAKRGHNIDVVTTEFKDNSEVLEQNAKIHRLSVNFKVFNTPVSLGAYKIIKKLAQGADLIHTYAYPVYFSDIAAHVAVERKIPFVLQWVVDPRQSPIYRKSLIGKIITNMYFQFHGNRVFKEASVIIVPSEQHRKHLINYQVPTEKMVVIPNGIDTNLFNPNVPVCDLKYDRDRFQFVVLYVGRIDEQKGLDILLKAFPEVLRRHPDTLLVVIGLCDQASYLREIHGCLGEIKGHVKFIESISHHQLPKYYKSADVLAFPSRYESFGMVPLEAMACGTPVVGTPVGVVANLIRRAGVLVRKEDPENLAEALNKLLSESELRERLGKKGVELVSQKYRWEKIIDRYEAIYRSCVMKANDLSGHINEIEN